MKVHFGQIYIEPGVNFPFSHGFQLRLGKEITDLVSPSPSFIKKYGPDWELMFRISAKSGREDNEIRGPTVFRKDKDLEYTVFLPDDTIKRSTKVPETAMQFLLEGCCTAFEILAIDTAMLKGRMASIIEQFSSDPKTFD